MHLSSRWGVPSWVIEQLPISEFNRQKVYWSVNKWGIQDHLLALLNSQVISDRTKEKPIELGTIKDIVINETKYKIHKVEDPSKLRDMILGTLAPLIRHNDA